MVFNNGLLMFREGALIAIWGGRILLDTGGSHFELLVVPLRYNSVIFLKSCRYSNH